MVAKYPALHRMALPTTENYLAPKVSSTQVEKSCFDTGSFIFQEREREIIDLSPHLVTHSLVDDCVCPDRGVFR